MLGWVVLPIIHSAELALPLAFVRRAQPFRCSLLLAQACNPTLPQGRNRPKPRAKPKTKERLKPPPMALSLYAFGNALALGLAIRHGTHFTTSGATDVGFHGPTKNAEGPLSTKAKAGLILQEGTLGLLYAKTSHRLLQRQS